MEKVDVLLNYGFEYLEKMPTGESKFRLDYYQHNNIQSNDVCVYYAVLNGQTLTLNKVTETGYGNTDDTFMFKVENAQILKMILNCIL